MITQSDAALAAWRATERTLDAKVVITDSNGKSTEYGTADITSIGYDSGAWTGDTFSIGSTYENNITVAFAHLVEGLKQGFKVTAKIGIKLPDGTYEYAPLGIFIISDEITMDRNNDATTIKAYDQMCVMQGTYTSKLTYPAKVIDVIAEIANMAGVKLNTDDIARLPVLQDLPSAITGQSYCTAIGWIAQFYGGFATFDRDGKLTIRQVTDASYTLDPSQYLQAGLTKNEATYQIGGIQCQVTTTTKDSTGESSENTTTLQAGSTAGSQIQITNNLMTQDRLDAIWSAIKDITFYPYSLTWFGNPVVEAGDWLTVQDTKGNKFNVPNNSYTMTFDGSLSATSKADQTSTSSSSYSYSGTLSQVVKQLAGRQGATGNYIYGTDTTVAPANAKIGDLWYKQNGNKVEMWLYEKQSNGTGKWVKKVDDLTGAEISEKVNTAMSDADIAKQNANNAVETGNQALAKAQTGIDTANAAADKASGASTDANKAINDSATAIAQAQSAASAASNSVNIANAVKQSVTDLKGGSTATIAELENGLALKVTKDDFSTLQNQVNDSAVGENLVEGTYGPFTMGYGIPLTTWQDGWAYSDLTKDTSSFTFGEVLPQGGSPWDIDNGCYPVKGTTYTQSIYIKTDAKLLKTSGGITWTWFNNPAGHNIQPATLVSLGNNIYRMTGSYTWNLDNAGLRVFDIHDLKLSFDFTNATYIAFQHPKLEVGSHTTPWCLASSEVAAQSWTSNQITVTADMLQQQITTVKKTADTAATNITTIRSDISGIKTSVASVQSTANQSKTDVTTLKQQATGFQTSISSLQQNKADQSWTTNQINATSNSLKVTIADIQGQVNDSTVGVNLLTGTTTLDSSNWTWDQSLVSLSGSELTFNSSSIDAGKTTDIGHVLTSVQPSSTYTLSWNLAFQSSQISLFVVEYKDRNNTTAAYQDHYLSLTGSYNTANRKSMTFTTQSDCAYVKLIIRSTAGGTYNAIKINFKLEPGSHATPWCLAPSEVATATSVTNLSATVDGLSATVQKKVDTTTFTSYQTQTATAIADKVSSSTFNSYKTQTDSAIQSKVSSADYNTKVTQLNNMINSKVTAAGDITNIVLNPYFDDGSTNGWSSGIKVSSGNGAPGVKYYGGQSTRDEFYGNWFNVAPGEVYYFQMFAWQDSSVNNFHFGFEGQTADGTKYFYNVGGYSPSESGLKSGTFIVPSGIVKLIIWTQVDATSNFGTWWFTRVYVGKTAPAGEMYSQIQQLSDNINLRVQKNDVINQINVSSESILIAGNKVHITGSTTIDNAVVKSAMIDSLSADKITAGTLNAANVNVINLNANNISTGTLTGVTFHQSSSGHDTWVDQNGIHDYDSGGNNAWIQKGTLQVYDNSNQGFFMSGGTLQLTSKDAWNNNSSFMYATIKKDNALFGQYNGLDIIGNEAVAVMAGTSASTSSAINYITGGTGFMARSGFVYLGSKEKSTTTYAEGYDGSGNGGFLTLDGTAELSADSDTYIQSFKGKVSIISYDNDIYLNANSATSYIRIYNDRPYVEIGGNVYVHDNFSVTGSKNAIVETSAGWARINAYETAEYYFGDMAKVNTGSGSKVKIMMDSLFLETVNTNIDYHVFVSSYGAGYAWVSEQTSTYFVIESNVPNLEVSYEIKAKRKGYENVRLEIDKDFRKEAA